jgi:hypothetical protein
LGQNGTLTHFGCDTLTKPFCLEIADGARNTAVDFG